LNECEFALIEGVRSRLAIPELFRILEIDEPENFVSLVNIFKTERRRYENRNLHRYTLAEGIKDVLGYLKSKQVIVWLTTNNDLVHIREILKYHNLIDYFDALSGDLKDGNFIRKPDPHGLIVVQGELITKMGDARLVLEGKSLYFGDNDRDGEAVRALNTFRREQGYDSKMEFVGVDLRDPHMQNAADAIKKLKANYYIGNFSHIINSGFALTPFL
jgi:phosphoglycolate phosphatase-like HAD superfamily hydrolase